jgi:multidrug efflux pump subunit AcrA (membrane-fusion protein)
MTAKHALLLCVLLAAIPTAGAAHDDHAAGPAIAGSVAPRLESSGAELELVATAEGHKLTLYLDRLETNAPVDGATIEVSGDGIAAKAAKPVGPGTYEVEAPWADEPGSKALVFTVTAGASMDLLNGVLEIPALAPALEAPSESSSLFTRPSTWVFGAIALLAGFFLSFAFRPLRAPSRSETAPLSDAGPGATEASASKPWRQAGCALIAAVLAASLLPRDGLAHGGDEHGEEAHSPALQGVDTPRRLPDGNVFLPKPSQRLLHIRTEIARTETARKGQELIGTVVPDPSSFGQVQAPMDGRIELSGRGISHVGQRVEAGEVLALLFPTIPVADLGTMQQLTAEVAGKLKIAEQKLARLKPIAGIIAQKEIDDTEADLEALREQQRVLAPKDAERIELKAPVSGIISVANVRTGQVVTTRDTLFEIVEPDRIWIEAIGGSGHDTTEIAAANATDADGHVIRLSYIGRAPALRQQSLPLQFRVEEAHAGLLIGSAVKVVVQQGEPARGIVLPEAAVVRSQNGLPQVWAKVSAERFKPLLVRTTPLDGARVLVLAGVEEGSRIVVEGAELINQVR